MGPSPKHLRVAVIQVNATHDWNRNQKSIHRLVRRALRKRPGLIAFPETFIWRGPSRHLSYLARKITPEWVRDFQKLARDHRTAFLLGSVIEPARKHGKFYNTSVLINEKGKIAARYRKIHLFDSTIRGAATRESQHITPGRKVVTGKVKGITVGLSVCYDLRFPELYRRLSQKGARILFIPANFTCRTGEAHWEVLLRSRAVENLSFVVAPAQVGIHPGNKIRSFGSSLVVDYWGRILARASRTREQVILADLNLKEQKATRRAFPVLTHRKLT